MPDYRIAILSDRNIQRPFPFNPFLPIVKPLRDDSALRALSSQR